MRFIGALLRGIIAVAVLGAAWWGAAAAEWLPPDLLPGPVEVANKARDLIAADAFLQHAWASLDVLLYGLLPALLLGILIGTLAGGSGAGRPARSRTRLAGDQLLCRPVAEPARLAQLRCARGTGLHGHAGFRG